MSKVLQRPGEIPVSSGIYVERWFNGEAIQNPRIIHMEVGDKPLPPTQFALLRWELILVIE